MRSLAVLICALSLAAGCSSSPAPSDSRPGDLSSSDHTATDLARPGEARIDLRPDGPRPPAVWKSIPGAPKLQYHAVAPLPGGDLLVVGGANSSSGSPIELDKAHRYDFAANGFVDAGKLAEARHSHSATALADGRVLVTGGELASGAVLKSAELYDPGKPAAAAWSPAAPMLTSTTAHTALRLPSGMVLVTGGLNFLDGVSSKVVQLYDPASNAWQVSADQLKEGRRCHTMTLLKNGKVLLAGGVTGFGSKSVWIPSLEVYDPASGMTKLLASKMQMGRCGHTATLLDDGRVLIVGGHCGDAACPKTFGDDLYDPATDQLHPIAHPGDFPSAHIAARLLDGRVLVAKGDKTSGTAFYFEPQKSAWLSAPPMLQGRWLAQAERLTDGSVLVVGGLVSANPFTHADTAERFFP